MAQKNTWFLEELLKPFIEKVDGPFHDLLEQIIDQRLREYFAQRPAPDPQYTAQEVAELLAVDVATVRTYFRMPEWHVRRLPYVECTETSRGYRVRLSDVRAWQERNRVDALNKVEQQVFEKKVAEMGARRRARGSRRP